MPARIAVIGAGNWARRYHLPALLGDPRCTISAIVDTDLARAHATAAEFGVSATFATVEELIAVGEADGAVVATPHGYHADISATLLVAGIPVLVEKPLTLTSADANHLVSLVESTGVALAVGYTAQYTEAATAAKNWVQNEIGELRQVIVEFSSRAGSLYAASDPDDPLSAYSAATGSGQATTQLSHAFGAITSTTDRAFTELAAFTHQRGTRVDVDDVVAFRLEGDVTGVAASTGTVSADLPMRHSVRYLGQRGIVEHDLLFSTATLDGPNSRRDRVRPNHLVAPYPSDGPVRAFITLITEDGPNPAPVWPAAAAVAAIEALHASASSGAATAVAETPCSQKGTSATPPTRLDRP